MGSTNNSILCNKTSCKNQVVPNCKNEPKMEVLLGSGSGTI